MTLGHAATLDVFHGLPNHITPKPLICLNLVFAQHPQNTLTAFPTISSSLTQPINAYLESRLSGCGAST